MIHKMRLFDEPFQAMKSGKKTVEVRLNDEKRRNVEVGDQIQFSKLPEGDESLNVEIIALDRYGTFREMYEAIPAGKFAAEERTIDEMVMRTYDIYSKEQEQMWGTLAISVKLLK
ncbi:ASCH domain-containing protein [Evansella halocellulosilytica]|uniref:ASCH domain-containing protein n=1 Tax=Evansella halocellulosilytica TaxID=2011013 RepID=UPI000BB775A6|nr:ASCH domain-containing protein [Evansella halocellulosilytica]